MTKSERTAREPFYFFTVAHVTRAGNQTAITVRELLYELQQCSDESIFYHMAEPSGKGEERGDDRTTNDFANWVQSATNCSELCERLTSLDECSYASIQEIRNGLCAAVQDYITARPECADLEATQPFRFCEGLELSVPLKMEARTLPEFRAGIQNISSESFYWHFVASTTRTESQSNDFSVWLAEYLGLDDVARKINDIDLTDCTLDTAREKVLRLLDEECTIHEEQAIRE
jgi:hypothetical protein